MIVETPAIPVFVKSWALTNFEKQNESEFGWLHSVRAVRHKPLQFGVLLESGALFYGLPIHALSTSERSEHIDLSSAQFWSNLSDKISITEIAFLRRIEVSVRLKDESVQKGIYRFTIDFEGHGTLADTPDEYKAGQVVELDSGNLVCYPNNRILFHDASLTRNKPLDHYRVQTKEFSISEGGINGDGRWSY